MPIYDFICNKCEQKFEKLVKMADREKEVDCPNCNGGKAHMTVSPVRIALDGCDPAFPDAYDKWARVHEQAAKKANAAVKEHGSENNVKHI